MAGKSSLGFLKLSFLISLASLLFFSPEAPARIESKYEGLTYPERGTVEAPHFGCARFNTNTGNFYYYHPLVLVPNRGLPVELRLNHNSDHRSISSPFGFGWNLSYNIRYMRHSNGNVTLVWGDGRQDTFTKTGSDFTSPAGVYMTLSESTPGELVLRTKHGIEYVFGNAVHQKLTSIEDPNGNSISLSYDADYRLTSVTGEEGRVYNLKYDAEGRLIEVEDPNLGPRSYTFAYDSSSRLTAITDPLSNVTAFAYDSENLITGITDPRGNNATFTYLTPAWDSGTRLPQTASKGGSIVTFAFDDTTKTTTLTDPKGNSWGYIYDGPIASLTDPEGNASTFTWDQNKNLLSVTDRNGNVTAYTYDTQGNILTLTDAASNISTFTYEGTFNQVSSATDRKGNARTYQYDAKGNLIQSTDPPGNSNLYAYDAYGQMTTLTDRNGNATSYTYDTNGNLISKTDSVGNQTDFTYDGASRLKEITDANGNVTTYAYDSLDRVISATDGLGNGNTFTYDANDNLVSQTDRNNATTTYAYDSLDRLVSVTDPLGNADSRTYDGNGNLTTYTDRRGNNWNRGFDILDRAISRTNPSGNTWTYAYDPLGNLVTHTDAKGQITQFQYDALNRLARKDFADTTSATFTYDPNGNVLSAKDSDSDYSYIYDSLDRRTQSMDNDLGKSVLKTYDKVGNIVSKTGPEGDIVTYAYDTADRRVNLTDGSGISTFTYDPAGNRVSETRPNGVGTTYSYDADNRLSSIIHKDPLEAILQSFAYTRDKEGRVIRTDRETGEIITFTNDALGRLTRETGGVGVNAYQLDWGYDKNGNRIQSVDTKGIVALTTNFSYNASNRLTSSTSGIGVTTYTYDANGSRILRDPSGPTFTEYSYDARNRLVSYKENYSINPILYTYDVTDGLIGRTFDASDRRFMHSGRRLIAEYDGAGNPQAIVTQGSIHAVSDVNTGEIHQSHIGGNILSPVPAFLSYGCALDNSSDDATTIDYLKQLDCDSVMELSPYSPTTLTTNPGGQKSGSQTYYMDGGNRYTTEPGYVRLPQILDGWMNGFGEAFEDINSGLALKDGVAYDPAVLQPVNPYVERGHHSYESTTTPRFLVGDVCSSALIGPTGLWPPQPRRRCTPPPVPEFTEPAAAGMPQPVDKKNLLIFVTPKIIPRGGD